MSAEAKQLISPSASSVSPALTESTRAPSTGSVLISEDILARSDLLLRHFDVWFEAWARLPLLSILHPEQTYRAIREKTLDQNIARCICAITTRFIYPDLKYLPPFAEKCVEDVDQHILRNVGSFLTDGDGLDNLIILIITVCYFWIEGSMGKVWMYMGLAGRLVTALQLNWEGAVESPVRQEIIRRAVWTLWKLDRYLANGFDEHLVLRDDVMHLKVPASDQGFPEESDTVVAAVSPNLSKGLEKPLCAYLVRLYRMKHLILGVTKKLAESPTSHPRSARIETSHFLKQVVQLQSTLLNFNQTLPAVLKVSDPTVIERWVNTTDCGSFVMMYTVFWELYIDLYRFSIPGLREEASAEFAKQLPPDFVEKSQKQAVGYAVSLSQFWRSAQAVVLSRPWVNGRERLLTVDQTLILHVIQVTKVLLAARQHHLYDNLEELSSAPSVVKEVVNDDTLMALIQSNLKIFDAFAVFFPVSIETHTRDLRLAVEGIHNNIPYDNPRETIGLPARKAPENVRLPGPHYMLEQAIAPPHNVHHDRPHQNASKADDFLRSKRQSPRRDSISSSAEPSQPGQRPEIPIWLASARMAPGAPSRTQSAPQRSPSGRAPPPTAEGLGSAHQQLYARAGSWSTPGSTMYNGGTTGSPLPLPPPPPATNQHSYTNPIFGLGGAPDTHPGFYHRAGGQQIIIPIVG
ncbi:hypothetical protein BD289DRAFT_279527 [Coniella lustricola]|uniref:Xylanolytic transcriptional activator regulatory domain-containing protein n=1 Tax=Coniella lustricola TaxID=2025994 RepID=A0A2T3A6A4_9PEZI|nr:hypothetical protein BD289DRAFT_279527 [Coniella lustricola]